MSLSTQDLAKAAVHPPDPNPSNTVGGGKDHPSDKDTFDSQVQGAHGSSSPRQPQPLGHPLFHSGQQQGQGRPPSGPIPGV